jgi:hypothetical protein
MNRTGFPSPKKKKIAIKKVINNLAANPKVKLDKNSVKNNLKSPKASAKSSADSTAKSTKHEAEVSAKKKVPKQVKMDRFITKSTKTKSSQQAEAKTGDDSAKDNSRRSATLSKKNYR